MNYCGTDYSDQIEVKCSAKNLGEDEFWQTFKRKRRGAFGLEKQKYDSS